MSIEKQGKMVKVERSEELPTITTEEMLKMMRKDPKNDDDLKEIIRWTTEKGIDLNDEYSKIYVDGQVKELYTGIDAIEGGSGIEFLSEKE